MIPIVRRLQIRHLYPVLPVAMFAFLAAESIKDNGFLWHIRAGTAQLETGRALTTDVFTYSRFGEAWRTQSWIAELIYGWLEQATNGITWAPLMIGIIGATALALVGVSIYGATRAPLEVALWLIVGLWLAVPFAQPRPVIFSYLLLAAVALTLRLDDRVHWAVVPLIWLWAGLHGTWIMGIGLVILEAIRRRDKRTALLAGVAAVAATFTAHGFGVWEVLVAFAKSREALATISEWQAPEFGEVIQGPYLLIVAGVVIAAARGRIDLRDLWIVVPFLLFGLTTQRSVTPAAIVLLPYAALAFDAKLPRSERQNPLIPWIVGALIVGSIVVAYALPREAIDPERFVEDEALEVVEGRRFFHDDSLGGYLIYREWPDSRIYIDDRAELFGAEMFEEFESARSGVYEDLFAHYGMTAAIVKPEWPLALVLQRDGWAIAYEGEKYIVLIPDSPNPG